MSPGQPSVRVPCHYRAGRLGYPTLHHETPGPPAGPGRRERGPATEDPAHHRPRCHRPVTELPQLERDVGRPGRRNRQNETQSREQRTDGGLTQMWHRLARVLGPWYAQIHRHCLDAGVLHADETGWRVEGRTWWLWCFTCADATYYLLDESRARARSDAATHGTNKRNPRSSE